MGEKNRKLAYKLKQEAFAAKEKRSASARKAAATRAANKLKQAA